MIANAWRAVMSQAKAFAVTQLFSVVCFATGVETCRPAA